MSGTRQVVVIGGGMAAARLEARLNGRVALTVIGEEGHPAYNRVLLAEVLAGRYGAEVIALPGQSGTRWLRGLRAVAVDRAARVVRCADGSTVGYDALVLATGSHPVLPPLQGLRDDAGELPRGVHAFRTLDDCLALARTAHAGARAVVIGGGLLGVSAARALARRGTRVVLAQQGEYLMERQLDAEAAGLLRRHLEELGVEVHTECRVRGLLTRPAASTEAGAAEPTRAVTSVALADGYHLGCELVVLACGVRPGTGLARGAGLRVARGVVVDDQLRTSDPRIFAIGDCAEHDGRLYGLAGPAQDQADTLAEILAAADGAADAAGAADGGTGPPAPDGRPPPRYTGTRALTRLTLAAQAAQPAQAQPAHAAQPAGAAPPAQPPLDLATFGETEAGPQDDVVRLTDATRGVYRKVIVRGDRLVGGILLGDLGSVGTVADTWEDDQPLSSAPLLHLLTHDGGHRDDDI